MERRIFKMKHPKHGFATEFDADAVARRQALGWTVVSDKEQKPEAQKPATPAKVKK
jgi:hypothetical protein